MPVKYKNKKDRYLHHCNPVLKERRYILYYSLSFYHKNLTINIHHFLVTITTRATGSDVLPLPDCDSTVTLWFVRYAATFSARFSDNA